MEDAACDEANLNMKLDDDVRGARTRCADMILLSVVEYDGSTVSILFISPQPDPPCLQ